MKNVIALVFILSLVFASCEKKCTAPNAPAECAETVPTDELCQAYFESWFYNKDLNACEKIGYSGCSESGFPSQIECESCICISIE